MKEFGHVFNILQGFFAVHFMEYYFGKGVYQSGCYKVNRHAVNLFRRDFLFIHPDECGFAVFCVKVAYFVKDVFVCTAGRFC